MNARCFESLYDQGFLRVAACTPQCSIADPPQNMKQIMELIRDGEAEGVALMVFPELSLSGYSIDDLLLSQALLDSVETAIAELAKASAQYRAVVIVGAPLRRDGRIYNCAVVIHRGAVLGVVPKGHLPNYREFYEKRWFASGRDVRGDITVAGRTAAFGQDLLFRAQGVEGFIFHAEICEDMWAPAPPSDFAALAGALILTNLSASNIVVGKADTRRLLCEMQSGRCWAAYIYSAAAPGESTTDLAWDGQAAIYELGAKLAEGERFPLHAQMVIADIDLERLALERMRTGTFNEAALANGMPDRRFRTIAFSFEAPVGNLGLRRSVARFPYVPNDPERLDQDCYETFNIQVHGLIGRLKATGIRRLCIGISGGLDSTHALIVAARAYDLLGWPRSDILGFTMPGFATGKSTKSNAWALMKSLGVTAEEINIGGLARQMLSELGHPFSKGEPLYDITFENVQAGLRTDLLFRAANQRGALVLGTGDLSEFALGWCTYGVGDQMSHYNVNGAIPKTLIQHLIRWVVQARLFDQDTAKVLDEVLGTVISPELVPVSETGAVQSTEAKIGPYELHDFALYYFTRFGLRPSKIAFLALHAWSDVQAGAWPPGFPISDRRQYGLAAIRQWLEVFLERFFANQFKRSAMPNGPKVTTGGSLSPRGDWRMPSDATADIWLDELRRNVPIEDSGEPVESLSGPPVCESESRPIVR